MEGSSDSETSSEAPTVFSSMGPGQYETSSARIDMPTKISIAEFVAEHLVQESAASECQAVTEAVTRALPKGSSLATLLALSLTSPTSEISRLQLLLDKYAEHQKLYPDTDAFHYRPNVAWQVHTPCQMPVATNRQNMQARATAQTPLNVLALPDPAAVHRLQDALQRYANQYLNDIQRTLIPIGLAEGADTLTACGFNHPNELLDVGNDPSIWGRLCVGGSGGPMLPAALTAWQALSMGGQASSVHRVAGRQASIIQVDKDRKRIADRVWDFVEFDRWIVDHVIDTKYFQRLRRLYQLSVCKYVYPGATHSRLEHSLGVGHIAGVWFTKLASKLGFSMQDHEVRRQHALVQIAGLCHDLGHGPFSHTFESSFLNTQREPGTPKWCHERMSMILVDALLDDVGQFNSGHMEQVDLDDSDRKTIKLMIEGVDSSWRGGSTVFLLDSLLRASMDVVNNRRNGLDVDKFDYLRRDANIAPEGLPRLETSRLLDYSTVINGEICFNIKELHPVWRVFYNRYEMHRQVYTHQKVRAMELMLQDAFFEANHELGFSRCIDSADFSGFLELNDDKLLDDIRAASAAAPNNLRLKKSKDLVDRVTSARSPSLMYRFAGETYLESLNNLPERYRNEKDLALYLARIAPPASDGVTALTAADLVISFNEIHYGLHAQNPFDVVNFYSADNEQEACSAKDAPELIALYPSRFSQLQLRVYCKDNNKVASACASFRAFCDEHRLPKLVRTQLQIIRVH
eukprot:GHVT01073964.1.p1 GENE.GHVT01073964.1~~GHVT01073964.1.p1  ORF type:complete len:746 (+),score=63.51 GHVT01073964.1:661-2898(+)